MLLTLPFYRTRPVLATITAWEGLVDRARVHAGQTVLIHAGAREVSISWFASVPFWIGFRLEQVKSLPETIIAAPTFHKTSEGSGETAFSTQLKQRQHQKHKIRFPLFNSEFAKAEMRPLKTLLWHPTWANLKTFP